MPVRGPEQGWEEKYRWDEGDPNWKAKARAYRQNAAANQAFQDEQLGIRDDITDEASLGRALNEMGIFNAKEEGQAGFRRIMSRGMGYQQNLNRQNRDYYSNLWNREGLEAQPGGIWKDVRPNGAVEYRDAMGYTVDDKGKRTGGHYIGAPYKAGFGQTGSPTYSGTGEVTTPPGAIITGTGTGGVPTGTFSNPKLPGMPGYTNPGTQAPREGPVGRVPEGYRTQGMQSIPQPTVPQTLPGMPPRVSPQRTRLQSGR